MNSRGTLAAALLVTTSGCAALTPCGSDDLSYRATPASASIAVGDKFTATTEFLGCHGTRTLADEVHWSSGDTSLVRIGATSGAVVALKAGATTVTGTGVRFGPGPRIPVTVTP